MEKSGKKHVCPVCGRRFKIAAALQQHRSDSHQGGAKGARVPGRGQTGKMTVNAAPVSVGSQIRGVSSDLAHLVGVDRLESQAIAASSTKSGTMLINKMIEPTVFPRLKTVAGAFQRIKYVSMRFRVEPQISTQTSGGYVAAYVADPDDDVSKWGLDALTAQRGSVTTKWWQSSTIVVPVPQRLYYTSKGTEERERSPGRFCLMVDGAPTVDGNFTVFCEWSVQLSGATYAALANPGPSPSPTPPTPLRTRAEMKVFVGRPGIWSRDPSGNYSKNLAWAVAGARAGMWYQLRSPVKVIDNTGVTLMVQRFWERGEGFATFADPATGAPIEGDYRGETVVPEGTEFDSLTLEESLELTVLVLTGSLLEAQLVEAMGNLGQSGMPTLAPKSGSNREDDRAPP